jgi:hypothetical protein
MMFTLSKMHLNLDPMHFYQYFRYIYSICAVCISSVKFTWVAKKKSVLQIHSMQNRNPDLQYDTGPKQSKFDMYHAGICCNNYVVLLTCVVPKEYCLQGQYSQLVP